MKKLDMVIKNGFVIDPERKVQQIETVGIVGNKIVEINDEQFEAERIVDATDCLVLPGLIDFHTHIFNSGGITPVKPDLMLAMGVTSAVDAGTSGCGNYDAFYKTDVINSQVRIKNFLNVSSGGLADENVPENFNPDLFNEVEIRKIIEKHRDSIIGLKIRMGRSMVNDIKPLVKTMEIANRLEQISVCVHPTDAPVACAEIINLLRPNDIFCHMYHGRGETILDQNGQMRKEVLAARERGVIFDSANGRGNFCHQVSLKSIENGFPPDIISTDIGIDKIYLSLYARSLPYVMSKMYSMGIPLYDVVKSVTETPAKHMRMENKIGTLAPGAYADIAIFKMVKTKVRYLDFFNELYIGNDLLVPQFTLSDGIVAFAQVDFNI